MEKLKNLTLAELALFESVVRLQSLGRAAETCGMSASAASRTLKRIQDTLGGAPLFLRSRPLLPTPAAIDKAGKIRKLLEHANLLCEEELFNPSSLDRRFRIATGPNTAVAYGVPLSLKLLELAPRASLELVTATSESAEDLKTGDVDLLFWPVTPIGAYYRDIELPALECVTLVRRDHPLMRRADAGERIGEQDLAGLKRIILSHTVQFCNLDKQLTPNADTVPMPFLASALTLVQRSDCLLLLSRQAAESIMVGDTPFRILPLRTDAKHELPIRLIWHARRHDDPALRWLIGLIRSAAH